MNFLEKLVLSIFISFLLFGCGKSGSSNKEKIEDDSNTTTLAVTQNTAIIKSDDKSIENNITEEEDNSLFGVKEPLVCEVDSKKKFVYDVMHDSYLWADDVPSIDYKSDEYENSESILSTLKDSRDRFSFIAEAKEVDGYFEDSKNKNFGFDFVIGSFGNGYEYWVVNYVYPNSPAYKAGLRRSNVIVGINNQDIRTENRYELINLFYDEDKLVLDMKGDREDITLQKATYDIETILYRSILTSNGGTEKIGYFVFQDFIEKATDDLDNLFTFLKRDNINELILDLRYNRGGYMHVANHLASLIGGDRLSDKIFYYSTFNDKYKYYEYSKNFQKDLDSSLNLERVFVITTNSTCSASEAVINGLRASANGIEVIQIGDYTCGKPHGFYGLSFCDKYIFAVDFEIQNSDRYGGYLNGLAPTCYAYDDTSYEFGDKRENSLKEALYYIDNGRCGPDYRSTRSDKKLFSPVKKGFRQIMSAY
jgi:C-terminal processing protease CtpA/Prc